MEDTNGISMHRLLSQLIGQTMWLMIPMMHDERHFHNNNRCLVPWQWMHICQRNHIIDRLQFCKPFVCFKWLSKTHKLEWYRTGNERPTYEANQCVPTTRAEMFIESILQMQLWSSRLYRLLKCQQQQQTHFQTLFHDKPMTNRHKISYSSISHQTILTMRCK